MAPFIQKIISNRAYILSYRMVLGSISSQCPMSQPHRCNSKHWVKIAVQITLDEAGRDKAQGELMLKITDKGYQYAAYHFTTRPWTIADLELPMAESIKLEQIDAYFGELRSSQLFEWEVDTVGQKRIYTDGTEVTLYLGKAGLSRREVLPRLPPLPV